MSSSAKQPLLRSGIRTLLREYWSGTSLGHIDDVFHAAGFESDPNHASRSSGQRRALVDQYYAAIDWADSAQVNRFLAEIVQPVIARLRAQIDSGDLSAVYAKRTLSQLVNLLQVDGYSVKNGRIQLMAPSALIEQARRGGDISALASMLPRLEDADNDPWLAIGTAKEIMEHICHVVLQESGVAAPKDPDLGELSRATLKALALLPGDVPDAKKGAESIRRVLQGLVQVVQGTAELRNLYGTGHGRARLARVYGRHARLVVGAALAWSHFISETWDARSTDSAKPEKTEKTSA